MMNQPDDHDLLHPDVLTPFHSENIFDLSNDRKFRVKGVSLLSDIPTNVFFTEYSALCKPSDSDAPPALLQFVKSISYRGGFLGFQVKEPSDRVMNSIGSFTDRNFLTIFRFKAWWCSQWVGTSGSDLEMETQWILFEVPEIKSYVLIVPLIEGSFRSALHPGDHGHVMIRAESGSTLVKSSSFKAIAYIHVSDNPYNIMREACSAIRVHLNTFRLLEEKSTPSIIDRFGWCTWDAFYLTVDPQGAWCGVEDFTDGGVPLKFLIIDDGWQSISFDSDVPPQDCKDIVLGREQMTARLYRLAEGEKFRKYKAGSLVSTNAFASFDPMRPKLIIAKSIEIRETEIARKKAFESKMLADLPRLNVKVEKLMQELQEMLKDKAEEDNTSIYDGYNGMKAFT
uniref:Stachyose synthase n=1 Tax=Chenopodium quinoa TaxID=63459 RepID=A0A803M7F4_CHEQI